MRKWLRTFEPEYIALLRDSRTAWVTCQENNALAVVDIRSARVVELVGLGFKDHSIVKPKAGEDLHVRPNKDALPRLDRSSPRRSKGNLQINSFTMFSKSSWRPLPC